MDVIDILPWALVVVSELLGMIPALASNSIVQFVIKALISIANSFTVKKE